MRIFITVAGIPALFISLQGFVLADGPPVFPGGFPCCPYSDAALKTNALPLTDATRKLLQIQGVTFNWKDDGRADVGVIAQDVQKVYPQLVRNDKEYLQVDYQKLVAPLIEAVREMDARIKQLEAAKQAN